MAGTNVGRTFQAEGTASSKAQRWDKLVFQERSAEMLLEPERQNHQEKRGKTFKVLSVFIFDIDSLK
jgi:hypothetical protein